MSTVYLTLADLRSIFLATPDPCLILNTELRIVEANNSYLAATMTRRDEIVGKDMFEVFPDNPEDQHATGVRNLRASLERVLHERKTDIMPLQKYDIRKPAERGGSFEERYWSPVNAPVLGPNNELLWIIHRVQDVTDFVYLKQQGIEAERVTEELRNRCVRAESELYERAKEVARTNLDLKWTTRQLAEQNEQLLDANRRLQQETSERIRLTKEINLLSSEVEHRVEERSQELTKMYDQLLSETQDRERAESALRQAQRLESLGTLVGGVVHDLNNILAAMIGFTELRLDNIPKESKDAEYARRVVEAGERGKMLVRQMLNFAKQTEGEKKSITLSTIVKQTVDFLKPSISKNIDVRVDIKSDLGMVFGDQTQLQQVVMNLFTNALQTMRKTGGVLEVKVSEFFAPTPETAPDSLDPGRYMELTVRDTGEGMTPEVRDHIFDAFFTTKTEGTGLGLSVVRSIINQSSGHIIVDSEPGKGSVFTVYLPQVSEEGPTSETVVKEDMLPTGSERVLFVDDEEALTDLGTQILAGLGYRVTPRTRSSDALPLFTENPSRFDLVITDFDMPEMTGMDLAKAMHALRQDLPIILITGFSHDVDEEKAKEAGIRSFLLKPLTKRELATIVREVLDE